MTDVGHKPGREKTARYIADNVLDPAPVKGADITAKTTRRQVTASIHAPVKGRLSISRVVVMTCRVSIHAPVKDATTIMRPPMRSTVGFNPRPREGCDIFV